MKTFLAFLALFPIAAFSGSSGEDLFAINEHGSDALLHFAFEDEEDIDFLEASELSFLEMEESAEVLLPWATEKLAQKGMSVFEEELEEDFEEFEDEIFTYNPQGFEAKGNCLPTLEKVPEGKKQLFGRPKVVPSHRSQENKQKAPTKKTKGQLAEAREKKE